MQGVPTVIFQPIQMFCAASTGLDINDCPLVRDKWIF